MEDQAIDGVPADVLEAFDARVETVLTKHALGMVNDPEELRDMLLSFLYGNSQPSSLLRTEVQGDLMVRALLGGDRPLPLWEGLFPWAACWASPEERLRVRAVGNDLLDEAVASGHWEDLYEVAWTSARGGWLPSSVQRVVEGSPRGSYGERIELSHALACGDVSTYGRIVRANLSVGVLEPMQSAIASLERDDAVLRAAEWLPAVLQQEQHGEGWDDAVARVAILLAGCHADDLARQWSDAVDDDRLGPREESILRPLGFVDWLAGERERARRRAAREATWGLGWATAGDQALGQWVLTTFETDPVARAEALEGIRPRHTWLGLIRAQICLDLADIAVERGDKAAATTHLDYARQAAEVPMLRLHVGFFEHRRLLWRLPVVSRLDLTAPPRWLPYGERTSR